MHTASAHTIIVVPFPSLLNVDEVKLTINPIDMCTQRGDQDGGAVPAGGDRRRARFLLFTTSSSSTRGAGATVTKTKAGPAVAWRRDCQPGERRGRDGGLSARVVI